MNIKKYSIRKIKCIFFRLRPWLVIEQKKFIFLIFLIMPKIGFPMPTAKNRIQILNLHPKKHVLKKTWS